jgi:hypothetical protein
MDRAGLGWRAARLAPLAAVGPLSERVLAELGASTFNVRSNSASRRPSLQRCRWAREDQLCILSSR